MTGTSALRSIRLRLDLSPIDVSWLEGELVRRGARDAHGTDDGITVVVAARTHADAVARVRRYLLQSRAAYAAFGFAPERRRTSQTTTKTTTPTARIANATQPQSTLVSSG